MSRHSAVENNVSAVGATLWTSKNGNDGNDRNDGIIRDLDELCVLEDVSGGSVSHVSWIPDGDKIMVLADNRLNLCDLGAIGEGNKAKIISTGKFKFIQTIKIRACPLF